MMFILLVINIVFNEKDEIWKVFQLDLQHQILYCDLLKLITIWPRKQN